MYLQLYKYIIGMKFRARLITTSGVRVTINKVTDGPIDFSVDISFNFKTARFRSLCQASTQ